MKRLHRALLLPLCLSIIFSTVPAYASETGAENMTIESAEAADQASDAERTTAIEGTADTDAAVMTEGNADTVPEVATEEGAEADTTFETASDATEKVTETEASEDAETIDNEAAAETAEETKIADETEAAEVTGTAEVDPVETAAETAEADPAETAAETAEVDPAETAAEMAEAAPAETAVAEPEVVAAAAAFKSASGVAQKAAQMKLEVIDYLDEGFGDSQMLSSAGSRLLIDTYSPGSWDVLNSWLNDKKYNDFDIYISHYHNDHMGNVINILNDGKYKVSKLYLPDYSYMTGSNSYMQDYQSDCQDIMNTARSKGVQIVSLVKNSVFKVGDVIAEVLWGADYEDSSHDTDYINNN